MPLVIFQSFLVIFCMPMLSASAAVAEVVQPEGQNGLRKPRKKIIDAPLRQRTRSVEQWKLAKEKHQKAEALRMSGEYVEAITHFREAERLLHLIVESAPLEEEWKRDLAVTQHKMGDIFLATKDLKSAEVMYERALLVTKELCSQSPENLEWQRNQGIIHNKVGDLHRARGDLKAARDAYLMSNQLARGIYDKEPQNARWRTDLAISHSRVGLASLGLEDSKSAEEHFRRALEYRKIGATKNPSDVSLIRALARAHGNLATVLIHKKELGTAGQHLIRGRGLLSELLKHAPNDQALLGDASWFDVRIKALSQ